MITYFLSKTKIDRPIMIPSNFQDRNYINTDKERVEVFTHIQGAFNREVDVKEGDIYYVYRVVIDIDDLYVPNNEEHPMQVEMGEHWILKPFKASEFYGKIEVEISERENGKAWFKWNWLLMNRAIGEGEIDKDWIYFL